jgi:hypothetical protein
MEHTWAASYIAGVLLCQAHDAVILPLAIHSALNAGLNMRPFAMMVAGRRKFFSVKVAGNFSEGGSLCGASDQRSASTESALEGM